jgi:hypothetical protein
MSKKLNKIPPARAIAAVGNTEYIILTDGTVARRLKPTMIGDLPYYNMSINGKIRRMSARKLLASAKVA